MSKKIKERIHLVYGIALGVLILAVGVCFALSCRSIYKSGDAPFTRESIAMHFDRMAIPVYLCIAGGIGGGVLSLVLPLESGRIKPRRDAAVALEKLSARLDLAVCDPATRNGICKERRLRSVIFATAVAVGAAAFAYPLLLCLDPRSFSVENLNRDIIAASAAILTAAAVTMAACIAAVLLCGVSVARETGLVKAALAANKGPGAPAAVTVSFRRKLTADPRFLWTVRGVILVVGILFVVLGVFNGGMADVLGKAIRICTECIGLG